MGADSKKHHGFSRKLTIISLLILLIFVAVVIIQVVRGYEDASEKAEAFTARLARVQSDNIEITISGINLGLQGFASNKYYGSLFGKVGYEQVGKNIHNWVKNYPHISWILISDKEGKVVMIASKKEYEIWAETKDLVKEEEYFQRHKIQKTDAKDFLITTEKSGFEENRDMIVISRPIYSFDGSFAGVAAAAIDPRFFFNFTKTLEASGKARIGILINNKEFIQSSEYHDSKAALAILSKTELNPEENEKLKFKKIQDNGKTYLITYRGLRGMPVKVAAIVDENWIMSNWKSVGVVNLIFLALFIIFGGVLFTLVLAMAKQINRAEKSEKTALLANQAKSEFLAKMSHELRTPLNAIIGFSEMIDSGYFGPIPNRKQQERIHDINLCGNHLLNLINDILDYTKGEAGKLEIHESEVAVDKVVDESIRILQEKARKKKITISTDIPNGLPRLEADERKLKQVILNLVSNSIKFTKPNGRVVISAVVESDGEMKIAVEDNGIGIANEDIPVALSVFGQVRGRQQIEEEGTGLGLPLCKMLIELHDASFVIESELGKGTKVIITMPAERVINPSKKKKN